MVSPPVLRGASVRKIFIANLTGLPTCHFTEVLCAQLECRASAWETGNLFLIIFWNAQPPPVILTNRRAANCGLLMAMETSQRDQILGDGVHGIRIAMGGENVP